ncbi:flagellar biosynthesis protein FlhF [Gorillibacterium massiliense]|uniref:flagellar biosynthesis protein FlhF n=1 Tax=Gorillibacterium massiliense TaxID=1280390 RepID=UPI0004B92DC2|nr:flagellar biosynthesis protein FlhF [Gorillibacterium massiliense]
MRVKRYVVDTMPDALQRIRSEMGNDAVILNTKEMRSGGFLGLFSKKKIEVIAATDAAEVKPPASRPTLHTIPTAKPASAPVLDMLKTADRQSAATREPVKSSVYEPMPYVPDVLAEREADLTAARKTDQSEDAKAGIAKPVPDEAPAKDFDLQAEIRQMKEWMRSVVKTVSVGDQLDPVWEMWAGKLKEQEVRPEIADAIMASIQEEAGDLTHSNEWFKEKIKDRLLAVVADRTGRPLSGECQVVHFVGPTGVGKTTTIAKLAAEQVLKHHRKVGFITSDTYRIAAVEQLKTYATILNIPLEVVFSPQDLTKAFQKLENCDLIFMDTAGRNFRNEMYVSELNALLATRGSSETYLVLSLTSKYKDMMAITDNFIKFKIDKVLFTKMDETDSYGAVVNLMHDYPLRLSYITNGQNVPDDISLLDSGQLVNWIVEALSDE